MTFFDKLFTSRNNFFKNDTNAGIQCKKASESCSQLELAEEQVRVLVFRECERRGRKLLFDSDAVEKVPVESVCTLRRPSDVVEVNTAHAYRYKKPSSEVTALGEMVFGSVAISFKGDAVSKIHNIPKPKRLLYTTIIPTAVRCHNPPGSRRVSDCAPSCSADSKTSGCSSDSKLYRCSKKTVSSSNNCPGLLSPCQLSKRSAPPHTGLHRSQNSASLAGLGSTDVPDGCEDRLTHCSFTAEQPSLCSRLFPESRDLSMTCEDSMLQSTSSPCCSRRPSDGRSFNGGSFSSVQSSYGSLGSHCDSRSSSISRNCSGGSLCSLRRRWNHSLGTSLEMSFSDEGEDSSVRYKTKLGIALAISLSECQQTELEYYLLNHSLPMERILDRLRALIEDSYSRCDEFVHLTYTAFLITSASVVDLVKSRQDLVPRWFSNSTARGQVECQVGKIRKSISGEEKFVNEFCQILRLFEVKETNFFISTLLTAVLTHNLSWAQSIIDKSLSRDLANEKTLYNPLGAQVGDLCGMLGYPLKSTKVVVSGSEKETTTLSSILNILSYFIRCNNVIENNFEAEFSSVTSISEKTVDENFDSGIDCELRETVALATQEPLVPRCLDTSEQSTSVAGESRQPLVPQRFETSLLSTCGSVARVTQEPLVPRCFDSLLQTACTRVTGSTQGIVAQRLQSPCASVAEATQEPLVPRCFDSLLQSTCTSVAGLTQGIVAQRLQSSCSGVAAAVQEPLVPRRFDSLLQSTCSSLRPKIMQDTNKTDQLYPNLESLLKMEDGLRTECVSVVSNTFVPVNNISDSVRNNIAPARREGFADRLEHDKKCLSGNFVERLRKSETTRDCCNLLQSTCAQSERSLYPDIAEIARLENVRLEDLSSADDRTMFVDDLLKKTVEKSPSPDEGYATLHAGSALSKEKSVIFVVGEAKPQVTIVRKPTPINLETEELQSRRRKRQDRAQTINIPVLLGAKILQQRSKTLENVARECEPDDLGFSLSEVEEDNVVNCMDEFKELPLPCCSSPISSVPLPVCSLFGEVSSSFSPYQVLQAVTQPLEVLEREIRKDLSLIMGAKSLPTELSEAVCVTGDLRSWSVNLHSTKKTSMGPNKGLTVASSQMVADMLESFAHLHSLGAKPEFCLQHLEKKLQELYTKSTAVAELLMTIDFCNLELLTRCLDVAVNDVPLLLSVATTHTPELADRYGITFS